MEWIKCSERMPEIGQEVLCIDEYGEQVVAHYTHSYLGGNQLYLFAQDGTVDATHWQPLPTPPGS